MNLPSTHRLTLALIRQDQNPGRSMKRYSVVPDSLPALPLKKEGKAFPFNALF
jgi:hypothetical protein